MARAIEIKKPLLGRHVVSYGCPYCDSHLKSPVSDIGKNDFCPDCNRQFSVPGAEQWQAIVDAQTAAAERKAAAKRTRSAERVTATELRRQVQGVPHQAVPTQNSGARPSNPSVSPPGLAIFFQSLHESTP